MLLAQVALRYQEAPRRHKRQILDDVYETPERFKLLVGICYCEEPW